MIECSFTRELEGRNPWVYELSGCGFECRCCHKVISIIVFKSHFILKKKESNKVISLPPLLEYFRRLEY